MAPDDALPECVGVRLRDLAQIAVEGWRLNRLLAGSPNMAHGVTLRHVSRQVHAFLEGRDLEARDMTGQPYDPGLAVEVIDVVEDPEAPGGHGLIAETISPIVLWHGTVVSHGQVVTRRRSTQPTSDSGSQDT